ncbi:uncharacterized protein TNCV_3511111 [Trichonephila clavipes]|nr:uncharacterized protein TNCV_3511111 [Trichonephila clavipes]
MATPGSSFNLTPIGHEDNLRVRHHPRANVLKWRPARFNFPNPEVGKLAAELRGLPKDMDQEPTDFIYDLLKIYKKVGLNMSEEALVDHIFGRLEPQVQDYVEVRNPDTTT